ncbi:MAG: DUF1232 domain-containing protein [Carnobacterium sp.]|nr:DUF1232 domain-containing protein [Carnobacterium sp.]
MQTNQKQKKNPVLQIKQVILSFFNKEISKKNKVMAAAIVIYIISPFDFIPDFIPLAGYADDVILPILLLIVDKLLLEKNKSAKNQLMKQAEKI